jgi:nucleotide-binding universal stress UspA family protein
MNKKILIPEDGSTYSANSTDYLIKLFKEDRNTHLHLLTVVPHGHGEKSWMLDVDPLRASTLPNNNKEVSKSCAYLRKTRDKLIRNDFSEEQITCEVKSSRGSIISTIDQEACSGDYDAILVGRRGLGVMGEMFLGSISLSLLSKCQKTSLWIIDGNITYANRFLLAVHTMPASLMAADHLAFIIRNNPEAEILLYHSRKLFGARPDILEEDFYVQWSQQWCKQHLDIDNHLFNAHTQVLVEGGIDKSRITILPMQKKLDVSHDLLNQAKQQKCGTIVLGRRGGGFSKGLFGGVTDKVTRNAQDLTIWLVNS